MRALSSLLLAGAIGLGGMVLMPQTAAADGGWRGRNYYRPYAAPPPAYYGGYGPRGYYPPPGYYRPPPVYYRPPPAYYGPPRGYYGAPLGYGPGPGFYGAPRSYGIPPGPGIGLFIR